VIVLSNKPIAKLYPLSEEHNLLKLRFKEIDLEKYRLTAHQAQQLKAYSQKECWQELLNSGNLNALFDYHDINGLGARIEVRRSEGDDEETALSKIPKKLIQKEFEKTELDTQNRFHLSKNHPSLPELSTTVGLETPREGDNANANHETQNPLHFLQPTKGDRDLPPMPEIEDSKIQPNFNMQTKTNTLLAESRPYASCQKCSNLFLKISMKKDPIDSNYFCFNCYY
jgi:hypothetical protein